MEETFYNYEEALKKPLEVKTLVFSFNNSYHPYTKSLPDARIKTLINLERLVIDGFKEDHINLPNEISQLNNLGELSIYAENLVEIPNIVWALQSLTTLYLEINNLKANELKLSKLTQLRDFGIRVRKTETLSVDVFENPQIANLYIQSDDLKSIPDNFDRLINLTSLRLHCQNVEIIPPSIGTLSRLKRIDIYNKRAKSIDIDFNQLNDLEEFRWGQCLFFPIGISAAKKLRTVDFDVSYFDTIDTHSLPFQNLQQLELSFCKLKAIPKCFETLKTVKNLILGYSNFEVIEFDFTQLTNLAVLSFRRCENFEKIDMVKFINSIKTIKNLKVLETPRLSKEQSMIKKDFKFDFEWVED